MKYCGRCKRWLNESCFAKDKSKKDGLQERCTECRHQHWITHGKQARKKLPKEIKQKWHRNAVIRKYGITVDEFYEMLQKQNNKCAICGSTNWGHVSPSIDHDHKTGKVRGLLCNRCNTVLGLVQDDPNILQNTINYLKESKNE